MSQQNIWEYLKRLLIAVGIIGLFIILLLFAWAIIDVLLLIFLGLLLAVVLRTLAKPIARYTPLTAQWSLGVVVLLLVVVIGVGGWFFIPEVLSQTELFVQQIGVGINQVQNFLAQYTWGQQLLEQMPGGDGGLPISNLLNQFVNAFTLTLEGLANTLFVLFIGIFLAVDPNLYRSGVVSLVPSQGRDRAREVIADVVHVLRAWLLGRVISMIAIGVVIGIGLTLLDIPLALVLGIITGLLEFIPVVGPILSAVPAIIIAISQGFMPAVYVAIFYLVVQQLEGNVLTPIVQQKTVSLPPAITLIAVLAMSALFGPLGALVATPLAAVIMALIKMLYVQDILGSPRGARGE
ncbi:AI-2E family transporter [Gloeocapsopsis sp. IPPAS B-1203]|uniref:AI-2E family transporter n=1 Tax=Gloeocapsopsis sp. IPPAS B-1203 TaxID=2049454 RepID=UPI000C1A6D03|nr:AI-2E family transporter [Gloeocapsopsis sp. IPPAS B-1203]PIG91500.1 AI-2E family transporter [Gloeocapsopsis sp. IPPAS B-1203]